MGLMDGGLRTLRMCYGFLNLLKLLGNGAEASRDQGTTQGGATASTKDSGGPSVNPRIRTRTVAVMVGLLVALGASACYPTSSSRGQQAADAAATQLGARYYYGGASPATGFDCSGLTMWSWKQAGVTIPRTATDQYMATTRVTRQELQPGDLVFYGTSSASIQHVGIYVGNGYMIDSPNPSSRVEKVNVDQWWINMRFAFGRVNA